MVCAVGVFCFGMVWGVGVGVGVFMSCFVFAEADGGDEAVAFIGIVMMRPP